MVKLKQNIQQEKSAAQTGANLNDNGGSLKN